MPPEQSTDAKTADGRSDIYALAATLYYAVTGEVPFRARNSLRVLNMKMHDELVPPRQLTPDLSERADQAIRRALSADPEQRHASCLEFIGDLTGQTEDACSPERTEQSQPTEARRQAKGTARCRFDVRPGARKGKAILIDLSQGGIGLSVQQPCNVGDWVEVELIPLETGRPLVREARVCWARPSSSSEYHHIGCRWEQRLTHSELQSFISS